MASPNPGMYTPQVNVQELRRVTPMAPNTGTGQGMSALAGGIASVGEAVRNQQMQDAAVFNSNTMASTRTTWTQEMIDRQQNYKNGDDFTGQLNKDFSDYKAKTLAAAPKLAKPQLDQQLTLYGANLTQNAMQYQAKAQVSARVDTWNQGAEQAKIHVATNPNDFEDSYREQLQGLNALQIDAGTKEALASRLKADMAINAAEGFAKQDPDGVLKALEKEKTGNPALDRLSVEQRGQIENFANSEIRQRDAMKRQKSNELAADTKARITDLSASYRAGLSVDPKQELTPGQIEAAFPGQGMELWKDLQKDKRMGLDMKDVGQMNPAQLADLAKQYEAKGGVGAQDALMRHNEILQAVQQSIVERQKDPRGYAVQNGIDSKPIDFSQPQAVLGELSSRAANAARTADHIGVPTPLLSRDETKQLATLLDKTTPNQKASWLGALAGKLDSRAYQSLMGQVLPDNPVSAIVGSQIGAVSAKQQPVWFDNHFAGDVTGPEKILAGEKLLNSKEEKVKFPMPPEHNNVGSGTRDFFSRQVGTLFADRPQLGEATYAAFRSAYAGLLSEAGDFSGNGQRSLMIKAVSMAVGTVQNFKGKPVSIPQGMDPGRFNGLVKNAVDATAKQYGSSVRDDYQLQELGELGSGRYRLSQGNVPFFFPGTKPEEKRYFIIDIRSQYGGK